MCIPIYIIVITFILYYRAIDYSTEFLTLKLNYTSLFTNHNRIVRKLKLFFAARYWICSCNIEVSIVLFVIRQRSVNIKTCRKQY